MEDKIDLELGEWQVFGINNPKEHDPDDDSFALFKHHLASPPEGQKDKAWDEKNLPPLFGSFFCRPGNGKDRNKLRIRKRPVVDSEGANIPRSHEPPLCGGYALIYKSPTPFPFSNPPESYHKVKLRLSLNLQRFIRHQPQGDDPNKTWKHRLRKRPEDRSFHGDEGAFDDQDNWLPSGWEEFASHDHLSAYLNLVKDYVHQDLERSLKWLVDSNGGEAEEGEAEDSRKFLIPSHVDLYPSYWLRKVETLWEFPSSDPIADVWKIGEKLIHFHKKQGMVKVGRYESPETGRILNSPCFSIPLASNVSLKLYAKTNKRIRFEIVQTGLGGKQSRLISEAGLQGKEPDFEQIPRLIAVVRKHAVFHMNRIMEELRAEEAPEVNPCSIFDLFAEIVDSIPHSFIRADRSKHIRNLIVWLCLYGGYRSSAQRKPYAPAIEKLIQRRVISYDPERQFYRLTPPYRKAAKDFVSAVGDPLVRVFGEEAKDWVKSPDGEKIIHLRE